MRLLFVLLLIVVAFLGTIEFTGITTIEDPQLVKAVETRLLIEQRENSVDDLTRSLEQESLGQIVSRAANVLTTDITLISSRKSRPLFPLAKNPPVIIHARFLAESSNEEPLEAERYLKFIQKDGQWIFSGSTTSAEFYKNFFRLD